MHIKKVKNSQKLSILEVGCPTGYVTAYLQNIGYKDSLGTNISSSAINQLHNGYLVTIMPYRRVLKKIKSMMWFFIQD